MPSPSRTSEVAHFVVTGDHLTDICRGLVIEGRWEKAMDILKNGLHGIQIEHVILILSGKFKLTGENNDIRMSKDTESADYLKQVHYHYAGYIRKGDFWFRPLSYVEDYGYRDIPEDGIPDEMRAGRGYIKCPQNELFKHPRAMHYAKNRDSDYAALLPVDGKGERAVLFTLVPPPPIWMAKELEKKNQTPLDALKDFQGMKRRLEVDGHLYRYGESNDHPSGRTRLEGKPRKTIAEQMREEEEEANSEADRYNRIKAAALEQAKGVVFKLKVGRHAYDVPRAPFEAWALRRTSGAHLAPEWTPVSPSGLKMMGDDPLHSDWMIGAGIQIDAMYKLGKEKDKLVKAAYAEMRQIQAEKLNFKCAVLSGSGSSEWSKVSHPKIGDKVSEDAIIVLKNASPKYVDLVAQIKTGAVIVEEGGSVAHLVNVARELGVRIVRVPNARNLYPENSKVSVDCENGEVRVASW